MVSMNKSLLLCFLWINAVFGSNGVDILEPECLANGKICECGRELTLPCNFRNNTFAIAWMNPNDITPIAQCVSNNCAINPKYIDKYNISYDKTECIFNLTIIKLTVKDNGRKLVCSDGTNTDSMIIRVRDNEPLLFENTTSGIIQAISGCISNVTKVSFKWIKIYAHSKREKEITPTIQNVSITSCSNGSDCGNDQQIQYSEVITAKASENGNCYLKIVAYYGNEQKEAYHTVEKYMLEDRDKEQSNFRIVVAVLIVGFALILLAVVYLIYLRHKEKKEDLNLPKHNEDEEVVSSVRLLSNTNCSNQVLFNEEDPTSKMHATFNNNTANAVLEIDQVKHLELTCNENSLNVIRRNTKKGKEEENMHANDLSKKKIYHLKNKP